MKLKRGDVVLIVAIGDLGKPRPAIVVQSDKLGDETTSVLVCPLSSEFEKAEQIRPTVLPSIENGIRVRSQIMTDKIVALGRKRVRRVIGRLETGSSEGLDRALLVVLGLVR